MKTSALKIACRLLAAIPICLWFALNAGGQVQTQTTTKTGEQTKQVSVERGEVVSVDGNDLIVKMEDGTLRHFPNGAIG